MGGGGEIRWTDFDDEWFPNTPVGEDREDRTRSIRLSVHNRAFTLFGFSPELVVVNEERETNAQLYDYKRTRGELRFVPAVLGFFISLDGGREVNHFPQAPGARLIISLNGGRSLRSLAYAPHGGRGAVAPSGLLRSPAPDMADALPVAGCAILLPRPRPFGRGPTHHGAVEGVGSARQHRVMQNETPKTTTAATFGRSSIERLPPELREAVDAAIADGARAAPGAGQAPGQAPPRKGLSPETVDSHRRGRGGGFAFGLGPRSHRRRSTRGILRNPANPT